MYSYEGYDQRAARSAGTVSASLSRPASLGLRFLASSIREATNFANRGDSRAATGAGVASYTIKASSRRAGVPVGRPERRVRGTGNRGGLPQRRGECLDAGAPGGLLPADAERRARRGLHEPHAEVGQPGEREQLRQHRGRVAARHRVAGW